MRPLTPEERDEVLTAHPNATAEDLDRFEALLVERFQIEPVEPSEVRQAGEAKAEAVQRQEQRRGIDDRIEQIQRRLFPHFEEALQRAARRRGRGEDQAEDVEGKA